MLQLQTTEKGVLLPIHVHAHARRNAIDGVREGTLRVAVSAAPEKGKANRAVIALLSKVLGLPKSALQLISGETSPNKQFLIAGMTAEQLRETLELQFE
jgi:hypothetical protein